MCNAPSPMKGGGDVNLSGAAQQTHTNTQLCTVHHPTEAVIREIHTDNVHKLGVLIRKVRKCTDINKCGKINMSRTSVNGIR